MEKKKILAAFTEHLEDYRIFYPDATMTMVGVAAGKTISYKDGFELSKMVCLMTHSGLLQFFIAGNKMVIYKSREFLKVAEGFRKGAKVRFQDPRTPDVCHESVMLADGMRYDRGIPFIWNEDSDADCFDECNTFAVYWRPVEEEGK